MSAALDHEGVIAAADQLEPVEEVADELEAVVVDSLEGRLLANRPLMAGPLGPQCDERDRDGTIGSHLSVSFKVHL